MFFSVQHLLCQVKLALLQSQKYECLVYKTDYNVKIWNHRFVSFLALCQCVRGMKSFAMNCQVLWRQSLNIVFFIRPFITPWIVETKDLWWKCLQSIITTTHFLENLQYYHVCGRLRGPVWEFLFLKGWLKACTCFI